MRTNGSTGELDVVVVGGTVVSSAGRFVADVGIRGEQIVAVGLGLPTGRARQIDASGCYVLPGVIDAHVHPVHAETIGTASEAAAFGGVTTLLHFIYVESDRGIVESLQEAREEGEATSLLDFGFHARLTEVPRRLAELAAAVAMGVRSFKLFTAYRARGIMSDEADLFRAMERIAGLGGLTMTHAENGAVIDVLEERFRAAGRTRPEDHPLTRPPGAEAEAVHRVAALARLAGSPLYVVHISCAEALPELTAARARGQEVDAETCPHYLTLTANEAMPRFGARARSPRRCVPGRTSTSSGGPSRMAGSTWSAAITAPSTRPRSSPPTATSSPSASAPRASRAWCRCSTKRVPTKVGSRSSGWSACWPSSRPGSSVCPRRAASRRARTPTW
jgi:dihydroorotase-like cyclic amidohydrolase